MKSIYLFKEIFENISQFRFILRASECDLSSNPDHRHLLLHVGHVDGDNVDIDETTLRVGVGPQVSTMAGQDNGIGNV